jgi:hypothetical protein
MASWSTDRVMWEKSTGHAIYSNPSASTTFATTPTSGVVMPSGTESIRITVETNPIRFWTDGTVPTTTTGQILDVGTYEINYDPLLLAAFKFINTVAGASTVTITWNVGQGPGL